MRTYSIPEAAVATGATQKAIRRRVERGTLRSVLDSEGRRRIPEAELVRSGLHPNDSERGSVGEGQETGTPRGGPDLSALVERLERLAVENGRLRALEQHAGSHAQQLERDLFEARARVAELEALRSRRWWRRQR